MSDITIKNIHTFLSSEGISLTENEEQCLNSVFNRNDTEDSEGQYLGRGNGDGKLNNNEWCLFIQNLISKTNLRTLYQQLTNFINKTNENIQYDYFAQNRVINPGMYNEEILRKRFPEDRYEVKSSEEKLPTGTTNSVEIIDKSTNESILKYEYHKGYSDYTLITANNIKSQYLDVTLYEEENLNDGTTTQYDYSDGHVKKHITRGNSVDIRYVDDKLVYKYADNQEYELRDDGSYIIFDAKTWIETYYDSNGEIKEQKDAFIEKFQWIVGHQDTKEDLAALLDNNINKENALQIMSDTRTYNVINNVLSELCIDNEEYEKDVKAKLFQICLEQAESSGIYTKDLSSKLNGYNIAKLTARCNSEKGDLKIEPITKDTKIEQGITGNCWLLEKIAAMARTDDGLDILNKMYLPLKNPDGSIKSVIVNIQGEEYNIPIEEINGSNELSNGNLFIRAIEIGVFKYLEKLGQEGAYGLQDRVFMPAGIRAGGTPSLGSEILVGNGIELEQYGSFVRYVDKTRKIDDDFMQELMNTQNAMIGVSTTKDGFKAYVVETGEQENIVTLHAYSVIGKDDEYIYLIEPSNNKKTLRMTYDDFKNCFEIGDITPIKQPQEDDEKVFTQSGAIFVEFTKEEYLQILNNPDKKEEIYKNQAQKIKAKLQERFSVSKYDVIVVYNGRYFEYSILPKQRIDE